MENIKTNIFRSVSVFEVSKGLLKIPKIDTLIKCNKALRNCTIAPLFQSLQTIQKN